MIKVASVLRQLNSYAPAASFPFHSPLAADSKMFLTHAAGGSQKGEVMAKKYTKRADGRYQKLITLIDADGLEIKKRIYARTISELEAKAIKAIEDNKRGLFRNADITVGKYTEKWLDTIRDTCADNTYTSYTYSVKHIRETIGTILLQKLKRQNIQAAVDSLKDHPRTAQLLRMTINRICESAVDDGIIARNPCRNIAISTYKAKEKRALTQTEIKAIEAADLDAEERLYISLLYYCGLRRGEALALGRGDIDLRRGVLTVNHSLAFIGNKGVLKDPKTAKSRRDVPIPSELSRLLQAYKYDLYLFTRGGDFFTHSTYVKMWARIIKKLNAATRERESAAGADPELHIDRIQGLTAHIFRHNYASMLYKKKVPIKTAQRLLGHSTISVTMDIYTHLEELDPDTISAVENAFKTRRA